MPKMPSIGKTMKNGTQTSTKFMRLVIQRDADSLEPGVTLLGELAHYILQNRGE
jgi:hypothetical protein